MSPSIDELFEEMDVPMVVAAADPADKIPCMNDVWPLLQRLGCRHDRHTNMYHLPEPFTDESKGCHEAQQHPPPVQGFDVGGLRRHVCQYGIPKCHRTPMRDDEAVLLKRWIRYTVVPLPIHASTIPNYGPTSEDEVKAFFQDHLGATFSSKLDVTFEGQEFKWDALLTKIAKEGIDWEAYPVLDYQYNETCKIMMYVAEHDIVTFLECAMHGRCCTQPSPTTPPLNNRVIKLENTPPPSPQHSDDESNVILDPLLPGQPPTAANRGRQPFWNTLGATHADPEEFSWGSPIGWRMGLGRAYYASFKLRGLELKPGDFVVRHETLDSGVVQEVFQILSAFQAMKSWVGHWNSKKSKEENELQKRGHCYLDLQQFRLAKGRTLYPKSELSTTRGILRLERYCSPTIPCWMLDKKYEFHKLEQGIEILQRKRASSRKKVSESPAVLSPQDLAGHHAPCCWDQARHAEQVQFTRDPEKKIKLNGVTYMAADSNSSDESDGNESNDGDDEGEPVKKKKKAVRTRPASLVSNAWFPPSDPLPQIVVHGLSFDVTPDDDKISYGELKSNKDLFMAYVGKYKSLQATVDEIDLKLKHVQPLSELTVFNPRFVDKSQEPELQLTLKQLGFQMFRSNLQLNVCCSALEGPPNDIIFIAPCGFGKSLCFVLPTILQGGITLVIEPLRTLVDSLILSISQRDEYDVEPLLNLEDSRDREQEYATNRLGILAKQYNGTSKPLIVVAIAELINTQENLNLLSIIASDGFLRRIVVDEFDVIEQSNNKHRETYTTLVPNIRKACYGVPCMFLSGTTTKNVILKVLASPESITTKVYTHTRALPDNLVFSVERKQSNEQVADRILSLLKFYLEANPELHDPLKVLCFCVTPGNCNRMVHVLSKANEKWGLEMEAGVVTSVTNKNLTTAETLQKFQNMKSKRAVHVLCVTKALGRGFHADDIRFVFHTSIPISASDYIQEAGRAGRGRADQISYCTLFFREQDCATAARVTNQHQVAECTKFNQDELEKMVRYCRAGDCCRYSILASYATLPECEPWKQQCHPHARCDVCTQRPVFQSRKPISIEHKTNGTIQLETRSQDITDVVPKLLLRYEAEQMLHGSDGGRACCLLKRNGQIWQDCLEDFGSNCEVGAVLSFGNAETSLANDLYRSLAWLGIINPGQPCCSIQKFSERKVHLFIKHLKGAALSHSKSKVEDFESTARILPEPKHEMSLAVLNQNQSVSNLPFLLQFEQYRTRKANPMQCDLGSLVLTQALEHLCKKKPPYLDIVKRAELEGKKVDEQAANSLFFSGRLLPNARSLDGILELLPPEPAVDRRIFRKYGSHRFLHINVPCNVPKDVRQRLFLHHPIKICGRYYGLLWAKHTKSPQVYVLFAEKGVGISKENERTCKQVLEWCLCSKLNPSMTLGKLVKRMKLCFSRTTASGVLPEGSVEVFPDIQAPNGAVMTDGCGLVSEKALQFIWDNFWLESNHRQLSVSPGVICKSFQGRLGGFKGTWVLCKALGDVFKVVCTESQRKFDLPLKCLRNCDQREGCDDFYDTMEVCRWNTAMEEATLNNRLIQCLESQSFGDNSTKLIDLLQNCVQERCQQLEELKDPDKWFQFAFKKHGQTPVQNEQSAVGCTDTKMLFEMSAGGVDHTDPTFARRKKRLLGNEFKNMRKKGHYPIDNARYVWIFPDFSGLLEEGEAYLTLDNGQSIEAEYALAMRSPSYFAEDLRKLRLVGEQELRNRKPWRKGRSGELPLPGVELLLGLQNALILSTKGTRPEAGKMSGGDYDGDICWVCWNEQLVQLIEPLDGYDATRIPVPKKSEFLEQKIAWEVSPQETLDYIYHHRGHQNQLGSLANMLDKSVDVFGFDHEYSHAIGQQAFLQVDHPYYLCKPEERIKNSVEKLKFPHWMEREPKERSKKALGTMWDVVENHLNSVETDHVAKPDHRIIEYVHAAANDLLTRDLVLTLREEMKEAIKGWLKKRDLLKGTPFEVGSALNSEREAYLQEQQKQLILKDGKPRNHVLDQGKLAAAVLYEQAHTDIANGYDKSLVQDIAWMLGLRWLTSIVGTNDDGTPALTVCKDHVEDVFHKRRKLR